MKKIKDVLQADWWHDEFSIVILTVAFFIILVWTFAGGNKEMFDYLRLFTTLYIPALLIFAGKRYADKIKIDNK